MNHPTLLLARCWLALTSAVTTRRDDRDERGDVPGWVLVTVMTAGLVAVIWGIADDELSALLRDALNSVSN
jgi:hypothetical protein